MTLCICVCFLRNKPAWFGRLAETRELRERPYVDMWRTSRRYTCSIHNSGSIQRRLSCEAAETSTQSSHQIEPSFCTYSTHLILR